MQYTHCIRSLSFSRLAMTPFALKYAFHPSRLRKSTKHKLYKTVIFSLPLEDLVIRLGIRRGAVWGLTGDPRRLWWRKDLTDYGRHKKKKMGSTIVLLWVLRCYYLPFSLQSPFKTHPTQALQTRNAQALHIRHATP